MKQERNLKLHRNRKNSSENDFDKINKAVKRLIIAAAAAAVMTGCASASPTGESAAAAVSEEYDLTGAGGENTAGAAGTQVQGGSEPGQESAGGSTSAPAGEKEKDSVTIVIPTVYEDVETQQEADEIRDRNGYESAVLEEDGSLTIVMSRSVYDEMIRQYKESVDKGIAEITAGDSSIVKIEYNEDYSEFTVTVSEDELGIIERQAADELVMYGTLYHVYTGNDVDHITVNYVNGSGETVETADSGSLDSAY